ncbi:hypothetical protein TPHA_0P01060 [Tetrapisispora phaffii CBS 4417]|uniref:Mitochondrial zinc maintenance protein 1, mitochondrial n=1 Tax=Tetrapisispora phaffii (strain ATCC 24235 / CBS 4417 / NBRC 1672 / NRRL Y-8282 / UCD 70-5) TaxID=1071381 RepID=G8C286_TETPH|nr:hypothetical protein TPHA_0P01060 [Tetrapisispora phaffii CBS 4417]CCE66264.1 hypothetical protein TPHA_0P01060 [Tetrapisispora phaffii CBS 4417]
MNVNQRALIAYRNGLRATKIAFNNDTRMLISARERMREGMINPNQKLTKVQQIELLEGVSEFLRKNIVQGKKTGVDKDGKDVYHLNIHSEIELGDNDSVKKAENTLKASGSGCCGGSGR